MEWIARFNYLAAKHEVRQVENYGLDLIWSIARRYYNDLPMPSELWDNKNKIDRRSAKEIVNDLLDKLGGE